MASSPPLIHVTNYEYNAADELLRLTRNFREPPGDPVLFAGPGAPTSPTAFVTSFSYDGNGSRTTKVADEQPHPTAYTWDARQRMTSVTTGSEVFTAGYDPFHQRIKVKEGQKERITLVDGGITANRLLYTEEGSGKGSGKGTSISREIWLGGQRVGAVSNGSLTLYHADALGSVIAQSNLSGTVHRTFYKPFGEVSHEHFRLGGSFRTGFVGASGVQRDRIVTLYYMWYRYQEPGTGAFVLRDPLGHFAPHYLAYRGDRARYAYASNAPTGLIDPAGLEACDYPYHVPPSAVNCNEYLATDTMEGAAMFIICTTTPDVPSANCMRGCLLVDWDPAAGGYKSGIIPAHYKCAEECVGSALP
jgi:RHS repeat-associated protein